MNILLKKIILLFVIVFNFSFCFSMLDELEPRVAYNVEAYNKLCSFNKNETSDNLFEHLNLKGMILENFRLNKIYFLDSELNRSRFEKFRLRKKSKIENSSLKNVLFKSSFLSHSSLKRSNLSDSAFVEVVFNDLILGSLSFENVNFVNCRFGNMRALTQDAQKCFVFRNNFSTSSFKHCSFKWVGFRDNNFSGARFQNTSFNKCIIVNADFEGASFEDVIFEKCMFYDCKNLDEVLFTNNVKFNYCEFLTSKNINNYSRKLIYSIENLGANVVKIPDAWENFKKISGPIIGIFANFSLNAISSMASNYALLVLAACKDACVDHSKKNVGFESSCNYSCSSR